MDFKVVGEYRHCGHGYDHPRWPHSCDGCFCDDQRDVARGWTPKIWQPPITEGKKNEEQG